MCDRFPFFLSMQAFETTKTETISPSFRVSLVQVHVHAWTGC